jgi:hypothetical protein
MLLGCKRLVDVGEVKLRMIFVGLGDLDTAAVDFPASLALG